ncbi:aliphatic sulfonates import ATP-binding protein SsuB 2 [Clostridia bacterium]|nr:aliphatic sulfonates import ATP-binding protein SsuB 2 [Clostridia bacterium]
MTLRVDAAWYGKAAPILRDFALTVGEGEIVTLMGASGAGKSTILNIIAGLHTDFSGVREAEGKIALIPQNDCLLPWKTVGQNLNLLGKGELLDRLGLPGLGNRYPRELSGGQRRRVALGQALNSRPDILLMDEPFSALDGETKEEILQLFLSLSHGLRTVFVTHDNSEARRIGGRVVTL